MKIKVSNGQVIDIKESYITIKDDRLYNTETKQYEAVDGDRVTFHVTKENGAKCWISGSVDGYTCGRRVNLRGIEKTYETSIDSLKIIEPLYKVSEYNNDTQEQSSDDWETILSAQ